MTPQEAIRRIKEHTEIHFKKEKGICPLITEALNMAINALEKQIASEREMRQCKTCVFADLDRRNQHGEIRCRRFCCFTKKTGCCEDYKFDNIKYLYTNWNALI